MRSDRRRHPGALLLAVTALASLIGGCGPRAATESMVVESYAGEAAELDFWDDLATRPMVSNGDALYGLALTAGEDAGASYEDRLRVAHDRGWIPADAEPPANESATMGMIAVAVCEILEIEGGVTMRVFGNVPRYCTRELMFVEIIPPRSDNQSITGLEFIDLVSEVEDRLAGRDDSV